MIRPNRLLIVTGLLPFEFVEQRGRMVAIPTYGQIADAMSCFLRMKASMSAFPEITWTGIALCNPLVWESLRDRLPDKGHDWHPIFLPVRHQETLQQGFANKVLWPLFHYFPSYVEFTTVGFENYLDMNCQFANSMERFVRPGDTVWIHDYQLLPLAALLRQRFPELIIGLFLHISFPSFEIFRHLPGTWQEQLLKGMLGADLIGFQTEEYATLFRNCARLTLATGGDGKTIEFENRLIKTGAFPLGIDYSRFNRPGDDLPEFRQLTAEFVQRFKDKKIIYSIDVLDYTKGVLNRIEAFDYFLRENVDYLETVVLILVIVPSREHLSRYAERKKMIDEAVSHLNGKFGTLGWQPVFYMYRELGFEELLTLYRLCNVALLTPLRDAMNLYAKEFIASRTDAKGILILSEFDGAAEQLKEALFVNPNDVPNIGKAIKAALEMRVDEQNRRMAAMRHSVSSQDVLHWGKTLLDTLEHARSEQQEFNARYFDAYSQRQLLESYRHAQKRLIFLDYDGTLMPFFIQPSLAKPSDMVLETLSKLAEDERNSICIISGRDSDTLEAWLGQLPIHIAAEHGARIRYRGAAWQNLVVPPAKWKEDIIPIMDHYSEQCPGSFVEQKDFSMVWHFRNADPQVASKLKTDLYGVLTGISASRSFQVTMGKQIVEVRSRQMDKGTFVSNLLGREAGDFILAIGDDRTDEDMFRALADKKCAYTIKVGYESSHALFNVHTPQSVISLLSTLGHLRS
ncbi:MAG TPA: bifunctional alpha,alpha-trehalose-phosphate synthase (UDP-forming)/trehalose-phosphatase [Puia sp.]|jgi:trehalose 6-phosphate synthase/phosphatase|nr:bifunctional alpha,alpha-trehalose-phosphate synthase (UDP-forming)/trehalose-phosphatase [Puia sp.]